DPIADGFAGHAGYLGSPAKPGYSARTDDPSVSGRDAAFGSDAEYGSDMTGGQRSGGRHLQPETRPEPAPVSMFTPRSNTSHTANTSAAVGDAVDPSPVGERPLDDSAPGQRQHAQSTVDGAAARSRPAEAGTSGRPYQLAFTDTATVAAPVVQASQAHGSVSLVEPVDGDAVSTGYRPIADAPPPERTSGPPAAPPLRSAFASPAPFGVATFGASATDAAAAASSASAALEAGPSPTRGATTFSPPGHVTSRHAPPPANTSVAGIDPIAVARTADPDSATPAMVDPRLVPGPELPAGPASRQPPPPAAESREHRIGRDDDRPLALRAAADPADPLAPRVYGADQHAQRRWEQTHLRTADPGRTGVAELRSAAAMHETANGHANGHAVDGNHVNAVTGTAANGASVGRAGLRIDFSPMAPASAPGLLPATPDPAIQIDYDLVSALQAEVSRLVIEALRGETSVTNDHRRAITRELTDAVVRRNVDTRVRSGETGPVTWPGYERALSEAVNAYLTGLGRLQPLIDDPDVENIMVLGTRVRVVYANGVIDETTFTAAASDEELISLLQRLAERGGKTERSLSSAKPILHLRLPDGARLTVIYMVTSRPVVVIRRHRIRDVSLDDMVRMDAITPTVKAFLEAAIAAHMNIMIAGRANSGKTTLLRAIADEIPREEWFAVMETVGELGLDSTGRHPWAVCFEEREGFGEKGIDGRPEGQLTIDDLFPHMLRLSTNRIIVGEVRAEEIVAMFDAMNTTYGSLCTIHSRDEHGVFDRLAELLLRYGASKSREGAYLTIGNALDFVVYVNMEEFPGRRPKRYVSSIMEVHGLGEGTQLARSRIFAPGPTGLAVPTGVRPSERRAIELQRAGLDMRVLLNSAGAYAMGDSR
ncbi:MAG TPA: ATPase, T2SS/T4P/T4SS family, partial [Micromonosporaceae bacterium]|nr:ATPase, T2SS/T4P/T4SS family [Micromonosporaceae bacterium]